MSLASVQRAIVAAAAVAPTGLVHAANISGAGATLAAIYLGDIKTWNDPAIKKLNPKLALPATLIKQVRATWKASIMANGAPIWK